MAVRKLQLSFETTYGTAAALGSWTVALPASKFTTGRNQNRVRPRVITGTRWSFYETRRANAEASWSLEMPLYYGMGVYPAALHFGAPTTAAAFTSAFAHTFKPGGSAILSGTFQYMKQSSANAGEWYQMTGCVCNSMALSMSATGIPIITYEGFGKYPTNISAPGTIATLAIEAYVHPDAATQSLKKTNAAWTKVQKLDATSNQGFAPAWTIKASTSLDRIQLGDASGTIALTAFQDDYTGSIMELNDTTGLIPTPAPALEINFTDNVTVIGTAGSPSVVITAPMPYTDDVNETDSDMDDEEDVSLSLAYDTATASGWKWVYTNMLPASTFTGH